MIPFYLSEKASAVVINPTAFFPSAPPSGGRPFTYKGATLLAYPHTLDSAILLRGAGVNVPSPIRLRYQFPLVEGRHRPRSHQVDTAEFFTLNPRCYCLNEIGTGKTYSALWAADYLLSLGKIRRVFILSPLSTLDPVWEESIFNTFRHRSVQVLHAAADVRRKRFAKDADFYVINHDGLDILTDCTYDHRGRMLTATLPRSDIDLFIIDELAVYRHANTERWVTLDRVLRQLPNAWVWGMTGTPRPNDSSDVYGQAKLIRPDSVPRYFNAFKQRVMRQVTQFKWEDRPEANDIVAEILQPSIRVTRDEAYDLPPTTYSTREVEMTAEQTRHYKELFNELVTTFKSGEKITAVNEGVKMSKLLQIACGVVYDRQGGEVALDAGPRQRLVKELIEEAGQKVIVFVPFRAVLVELYKYLTRHGISCAMVHGEVSKGERDRIFGDFQRKKEPRVLVADAGCMSHGLTLTEASTIVWYGPENSNDTYVQANGRITREGQKNNTHIIHIASTTLERKRYKVLEERGNMQGILLDMLKEAARGRTR